VSPGPLAFPIPRSAPQPFARLYGAVRNAGRSTRTTGGEPRGREPGDDYWVIVSLPSSSYTNGGYPSLPGTGSHPTSSHAQRVLSAYGTTIGAKCPGTVAMVPGAHAVTSATNACRSSSIGSSIGGPCQSSKWVVNTRGGAPIARRSRQV